MTKEKPKIYSKQVIEIADYLFENPTKKMSEVVSVFVVRCRKSDRQIERYISKAQEYNLQRLHRQEKAKEEVLIKSAKESIKKAIIEREEAEEILSKIARGLSRQIPTKYTIVDGEKKAVEWDIEYPADGERIRAVNQLARMKGWEVAEEKNIKITNVPILNIDPLNDANDNSTP